MILRPEQRVAAESDDRDLLLLAIELDSILARHDLLRPKYGKHPFCDWLMPESTI
jgi:hypothetical protein